MYIEISTSSQDEITGTRFIFPKQLENQTKPLKPRFWTRTSGSTGEGCTQLASYNRPSYCLENRQAAAQREVPGGSPQSPSPKKTELGIQGGGSSQGREPEKTELNQERADEICRGFAPDSPAEY